ncbi:MAG: hypothetical protein JJU23_05800 [Cyclobacteriaceae bacterium]|nr:hypothetical protein [Cyclobacteriaceae bacterium]
MFKYQELDPRIEEEMISRVLDSENDIIDGKTFTIDEAEAELKKRIGL